MVAICSHLDSKVNRLKKSLGIDTAQNKARFIESFRALC